MILADGIVAVRNPIPPVADMQRRVRMAQRFVFDAGAVKAAHDVRMSKPSSLLSAIHLCRPPYPRTWIEYPFPALLSARDMSPAPPGSPRPTPDRVGFLIEPFTMNLPEHGVSGENDVVTVAWSFSDRGIVNVCPIAILMRPDGDVYDHQLAVDEISRPLVMAMRHGMKEPWPAAPPRPTVEEAREALASKKLLHDHLPEKELEAFVRLCDYTSSMIAPCWAEYLMEKWLELMKLPDGAIRRQTLVDVMWREGMKDLEGEPSFLRAMLLLLNSRNAVAIEPEDMSRLNKVRRKNGKVPLLNRSIVRISLSAVQARRAYGSTTVPNEARRLHLVRGHFKVKKHGIYWWNSHMRGDPKFGSTGRDRYELKTSEAEKASRKLTESFRR